MAHDESNEEVVTDWEVDEVVQYMQYLNRRGYLQNSDNVAQICEVFEEEEIDGKRLWSLKNAKEIKGIIGANFAKEARIIAPQLRQIRRNKIDAPCYYQLNYIKIVDWESETVQQYIASIDPNGKYFKYHDNFKDITGDILLHKIENNSASLLKQFGVDDQEDRRRIWKKIQEIATHNENTPNEEDMFREYDIIKTKMQQKTDQKPSTEITSYHNDEHPTKWSVDEVAAWLSSLENGKYAKYKKRFIADNFDGEQLCETNENLLKDPRFDVKDASHRRGITHAVHQLLSKYDQSNDDNKEEAKETEDGEIAEFLRNLGFEQNIAAFTKKGFKTVDDLDGINDDQLEKIGVDSMRNRITILKAIKAYFEEKEESLLSNYPLNEPVKCVDDALVIFFGISKYQKDGSYKNLDDIEDDKGYFEDVFKDKFQYDFITNDCDKEWSESDAIRWIERQRNEVLTRNAAIRYNALVFCGASHGSLHSMICSNGKRLEMEKVRSIFASNVNYAFRNLPKLFIFNCCRTPYAAQARDAQEKPRNAGYAVSITGGAGNKVFGSKLSRFLAIAFQKCYKNKMNLHEIIKKATNDAKDKGAMDLVLQEHDINVGDVVFVKKADSRGSDIKRKEKDTKQISPPDAVRIIREVLEEKGMVDEYLDKLKEINTMKVLRAIDHEKLENMGVDFKTDRKKILAGIKSKLEAINK